MCVEIYCECSEFKESFCNVEQNSAGCRRRQSRHCCPRPHRRRCQLPVLSPAAVVDAASCRCCRLVLLLSLFAVWVSACCLVPAASCLCCCQCRLLPLFAVRVTACCDLCCCCPCCLLRLPLIGQPTVSDQQLMLLKLCISVCACARG